MSLIFFINSILLGFGLAMDAFSVSLANGFCEPAMKAKRMCLIAGLYALFQFAMPMAGWFLIHTAAGIFTNLLFLTPWAALILLLIIGTKMLTEGIKEGKCKGNGNCESCAFRDCARYGMNPGAGRVTAGVLLVQAVATSIDALSVGFTITEYTAGVAFVCSIIIAIVTFGVCMCGLKLGVHFGTKLAGRAKILGGVVLILIGLEIFFL